MSTILDALKKSEQERKLNQLPTLSDIPAPQEPARWPQWVIIALLLVLVIVLAWIGLKFTATDGAGRLQANSSTIVLDNQSLGVSANNSDAANSGVLQPESTTTNNANDGILVNVVSYSEQADQRFAMINGKMYRENEFVRKGLKVVAIEPNKVVLNLRGRRIERQP